jgi:hypothetical protein
MKDHALAAIQRSAEHEAIRLQRQTDPFPRMHAALFLLT